MSSPKLYYFNGRGRAELVRLIFSDAGIQFEDIRMEGLAEIKPKLPFGQVPAMEIDGTMYAQSLALARYAAKKAGLYPAEDKAALLADEVVDAVSDVFAAFYKAAFGPNAAEDVPAFITELNKHLTALENVVNKVEGEYVCGSAASFADFAIFMLIDGMNGKFPACDAAFPKLAAIKRAVESRPNTAAYIARRVASPW